MGKDGFLIDSSVILEMLLGQARADECVEFFNVLTRQETPAVVTVFSLYSVEINMCGRRLFSALVEFLDKIETNSRLALYATTLEEEREVVRIVETTNLDFDDALQYFVAKKIGARLVSLDKHFDQTDIRRVEPREVIEGLS